MKNAFFRPRRLALLLAICLLAYCFGAAASAAFDPDLEDIPFRVFYRGFTPVYYQENPDIFRQFSDYGTCLLQDRDALDDFCAVYCPGIPGYEEIDFSKECLLASIIGFARPTCTVADTPISLTFREGCFSLEFSNDPANYIYALNTDTVCHFYVLLLIVDLS